MNSCSMVQRWTRQEASLSRSSRLAIEPERRRWGSCTGPCMDGSDVSDIQRLRDPTPFSLLFQNLSSSRSAAWTLTSIFIFILFFISFLVSVSTHPFSGSVSSQRLAVPHASNTLCNRQPKERFVRTSAGCNTVSFEQGRCVDGATGQKLSSFRSSRGSRLKPARKGDGPERLRLRLLE